jgi:anti-anti-sigma regulatory factor
VLQGDTTPDFRDTLLPLAAVAGAFIAVDLSAAGNVDAAAVAIVRDASDLSEDAGGRLTLVTRDPRVRSRFPAGHHARLASSLAEAVATA